MLPALHRQLLGDRSNPDGGHPTPEVITAGPGRLAGAGSRIIALGSPFIDTSAQKDRASSAI